MKTFSMRLAGVILATAAMFATATVSANQIVLEGSDATSFHHDGNYTDQLLTFMQVSSGTSLPVLIMGNGGPLSGSFAGKVYHTSYDLTGVDLSLYSGLYIQSWNGCCNQAVDFTTISAAEQAAIAAAEAAGMSLSIENYGGGPGWGAILPAAVNALTPDNFGGITNYGTAGGPNCTDGEVFNAAGLSFGFTQPGILGCYEHQGYRTSAFTALGFVSLVNADPAYFGADGSALLALGGVLGSPGGVPEPASLALMGLGLAGIGAARRKRKAS